MKKEIFPSSSCFDPLRTNSIRSNSIGTERNIEISKTNVKIPWARKKRRKVVAKMQRPPREICTHGTRFDSRLAEESRNPWPRICETRRRHTNATGPRYRPFPISISRCSFPDPRDATCVPALQTRTTGRGLSTVNKG